MKNFIMKFSMWQKTPHLGLWAYHSAVLAELWYLEDTYPGDFKLYVLIDNECYFYDGTKGENPWEYYFFHPTHNDRDIEKYIIEERHPFHYICLGFIKGTFDYDKNTYMRLRELNTKYIKIKPHIHEKVNNFYNANMKGNRILGVQRRNIDIGAHAHGTLPIDRHFQMVDKGLSNNNCNMIYLVTDLQSVVHQFKNKYGNLLLHYDDALLSEDGQEICIGTAKKNPYKVGEDVVVEMLLLSRVNFLLAMSSNISKAAIIHNDKLEYAFVDKHILYH